MGGRKKIVVFTLLISGLGLYNRIIQKANVKQLKQLQLSQNIGKLGNPSFKGQARMAVIKGFLRFAGVFHSIQWKTLRSMFCKDNSHTVFVQKSPFSTQFLKKLSARFGYLKQFGFAPNNLSILIILAVLVLPSLAFSDDRKLSPEEEDLLDAPILQLMQTEVVVTSVSKRPELVHKAASAIYVLTEEDIRRSGAVNIMEALRMVPGVLVSKLNQNRYAISIRGFNQRLGSDKLLVLMDGRSIYSPTDAGVFWIGQDTVLEDIERIEVIRGPGAALWGSNAVAGVINIITKSAKKTKGGLLSSGVGSEEQGFGTLRYGGELDNGINFRVYGKYRDRDDGIAANGNDAFDDKQIGQGGFRTDWDINKRDNFTLQGDYYRLNSDLDFTSRFVSLAAGSAPFQGTNVQEGANVLSRWTRTLDDASSYQLQFYYDRLKRKSGVPFDNVVDQFDIDFQHNFSFLKTHNFSWGLNYRFIKYDLENTNIIENNRSNSNLASLFLHDEIQLIPDELSLILGIKIENNSFTGFEFQPSVRTAWNPSPNHTLWAAFSRAVRLPTVSDENITVNNALVPPGVIFPGANPTLILQVPNREMKAEELLAYELGYRAKINDKLNFDITAYYFDYDNLIGSNSAGSSFTFLPGPPNVVASVNDNSLKGEVYGVELSGQWQVLPNWRLSGSYTFADIQLHVFPGAPVDGSVGFEAEKEPNHIFTIRSYLNLPHNLEFDTFFYYVSDRETSTPPVGAFMPIPEYGRLDVRLGWQPMKNVDLSLSAQNLLDDSHPELSELLEVSSETQRSYYLKATLKF